MPITESPRLKTLKSAPLDAWILLSADERTILATGETFDEVTRRADEIGSPEDAVVIKTPKSWSSFSV